MTGAVATASWPGICALCFGIACGDSGDPADSDASGGTAPASGGVSASGGTGGAAPSTGGVAGTGGAPTGGTSTTGGQPLGGGSATGGAATGGTTPAGGSNTGGTTTGGGGQTTGGQGTGGQSTGGQSSGGTTGGQSSGGADTGGADTGGTTTGGADTGGTTTGGADTGGTTTAGAETGGADTGGAGTGGAENDACSTATALDAEFPECFPLQIANGIDATRTDAAVFVTTADIKAAYPSFNANAFVVLDGSTELASQAVDDDPDGTADEVVFIANLDPNQTKTLAVRYATSGTNVRTYPQRTQALVSPKTGGSWSGDTYSGGAYEDVDFLDLTGHIDHDAGYMRFEGPGWESDRIGYRVYLDDRNGIDIFGKKLPDLILQDIDYTDGDYSSMMSWGQDILHVGEALGVGSVGTWQNNTPLKLSNLQTLSVRILASGPVYALLRLSYGGWQTSSGTVDVTADISITAGSRVSKKVVTIDGNVPNLCAGMPKHDQATVVTPPSTTGWTYLATYGNQSLIPDALGIAVLYRTADQAELVEDSVNRLVVLTPTASKVTYYFLGAWAQEGSGITSQQQFSTFLAATLRELDSPVAVTIL